MIISPTAAHVLLDAFIAIKAEDRPRKRKEATDLFTALTKFASAQGIGEGLGTDATGSYLQIHRVVQQAWERHNAATPAVALPYYLRPPEMAAGRAPTLLIYRKWENTVAEWEIAAVADIVTEINAAHVEPANAER
jgi:hypothetical protein